MRISSVITAAIGVALFASTANAESSLKPLPANALTTARTEILAMPEPELRSLMNYLAECGDRSSSPSAIRACSSALDRYKMEFESVTCGRSGYRLLRKPTEGSASDYRRDCSWHR